MDGVEITDRIRDELPKLMCKSSVNKSIKSHEEYVFAVETVHLIPAIISNVLPNELFTQDKMNLFSDCQSQINLIEFDKPELRFGHKLKLNNYSMR